MAELSPRRSARRAGVRSAAVEGADVPPAPGEGVAPDYRGSVFGVVARHPILVLLAAVVCGVAAYVGSRAQAPRYEATGRLFLVDPNSTLAFDLAQTTYVDPRRNARTRAEIVLSVPVLSRAADRLGASEESVRDRVDAVPSREADVVTLTAVAGSPREATRLIDLLESGYRQVTLSRERAPYRRAGADLRALRLEVEQRLKAATARLATRPRSAALQEEQQFLRAHLQSIRDREAALKSNAALLGTGVQLFERATLPDAPVSPLPLRSALVATLLGAVASVGLLWWREGRDPPSVNPDAAAEALAAPLLADLPSSLPWRWRARRTREDAYRRLGYAADVLVRDGVRVLFVTAARIDDLQMPVALRLAGALAKGGRRVTLVDGDRHKRRLSRHLRAFSAPGLTDVEGDPSDLGSLVVHRLVAGSPPIAFLPLGSRPRRLHALEGTRLYRTALRALAGTSEVTVANGPALVSLAEANPGSLPEVSALVVCGPKTSLVALTDLRGRLDLHGIPAAGLVFDRSGRLERLARHALRAVSRPRGRPHAGPARRRTPTRPGRREPPE
jgi:capsular polysaccharide biosynthesis protein